jgi:hypothetical protein
LKNWEQGGLDQAVPFFDNIIRKIDANHNGPLAWYRQVADDYLSDLKLLKSNTMTITPSTASQCKTTIEELDRISSRLKTRGRAKFNTRSRQGEIRQQEKYLEKSLSGR